MEDYVGPYRILRLINRGGQGNVYLGYDKRLNRRVAIKVYKLPSRRGARRQLLREAQLVAAMQSPKIVQVHDVIESSQHLGMVMEYVPGCSLEEFLRAVRPSLGSVLRVGADIAGALATARQQHVVHGDLKAANVLIDKSGRVKLTDFGISRNRRVDAPQRGLAGSLSALSPEQYRGESVDERSDLFALGCLLYRMLSGQQPFLREGQLDSERLLGHAPRPLPEVVGPERELPQALVQLVESLLHKEPGQRPKIRRVRQVLRAVSGEMPVVAADCLLLEARSCFREESPDDIPLQVPPGLGKQGRSRMVSPGGSVARLSAWFQVLHWPARLATALGLVGVISVPVVLGLNSKVTAVAFEKPETTFTVDMTLPGEISHQWLVQELKRAVGQQLGELYVVGEVGADPTTALYSDSVPLSLPMRAEQVFSIGLRCLDDLCVLALNRRQGEDSFSSQGVLLPDMPVQQWRDTLVNVTRGLFP